MLSRFFGLVLVSTSVLALTACATSDNANLSNREGANRVDSILERAARDARASGNTIETISILEQVHARKPDDAAVATSLGQALREDEQLNRARQVLLPFTEGKKPYPDAVIELAMVQLALGQYKEAELTSRRAVELDPESGRGYLALGTALDAQNYHEQAEVAFRRGIDKWKGDPAPIMNNLALNLASQNKLDQAIDMLKKAKEISPNRVELERNLRIVTTLREGADDFLIKQEEEKKAAQTPKKEAPPAKPKADSKELAKDEKPAAKEAAKKPEAKPEPKKEAVKKPASKPEKIEPAATKTNSRGSTQNFN